MKILTDLEIQTLIQDNPGDFALYHLMPDNQLKIYYLSPDLPALSGITIEEYRQLSEPSATHLIYENDRQTVESLLMQLDEDTSGHSLNFRIFHKTRGFIWINAKGHLLGMHDGYPTLMIVYHHAQLSIEGHDALLDNSTSIIYVVEKATHQLLYANKTALDRLKNPDEINQGLCYKMLCYIDQPCSWCPMNRMVDGAYNTEEIYAQEVNSYFRYDCRDMQWFGIGAMAVYAVDITKNIETQHELEINFKDLNMIVENIPVGICVYDISHDNNATLLQINTNARKVLELPGGNDENNDKLIYQHIIEEDKALVFQSLLQTIQHPDLDNVFQFRYQKDHTPDLAWIRFESHTVKLGDHFMVFGCITDVTETQNAYITEKKSRQMYEAAVETGKLVVWEYDLRTHEVIMSDNDFSHYDYKKFNLPKITKNAPESLLPYIAQDDHDKFLEMYRKIQNGEPSASCEVWYRLNPAREPRCERISYSTVYDKAGHPVSAIGIGQNITNDKLDQMKYDLTIKNLSKTISNSLGGFRLNLTKNLCFDGISPYEWVLHQGDSGTADGYFAAISKDIIDPESKAEFDRKFNCEHLLNEFSHGITEANVIYCINSEISSGHIWVDGTLRLVQNPMTGDVEAFTYAVNITDKKKDEGIIHLITAKRCDFIALIYPDTNQYEFRNANHMPPKMLHEKNTYDQGMKHSADHFISAKDREDFIKKTSIPYIINALNENEEYIFAFNHLGGETPTCKQLQFGWLNDERYAIVMIQNDITDLYYQEQQQLNEMREARDVAQKANHAKSDFLSRISHDIRTPMNIISSMTDFAFEDIHDQEKVKEDLSKIKSANTFLLSLINDILDISKIDSGQIELHLEANSYDAFISNIKNMFEPLCAQKNIAFDIQEELEKRVTVCDMIRVNQIILNILSNAVKYTPEGGHIWYTTKNHIVDDQTIACEFIIEDNGIGMSEEFQKKMFLPFTQESLVTSPHTGTGLGLSIVKRLIDLMHGSIKIDSHVGKGTKVTVHLDLGNPSSDAIPVKHSLTNISLPAGKRVLLIEDHPVNTEIAARILAKAHIIVDSAENGQKGYEKYMQAQEHTYDMILMDLQMPIMNGYQATYAIRSSQKADAKTIPIIAMTANAYAEDVQKCLEAGMNGHIAKPLDPQKVIETIALYLNKK